MTGNSFAHAMASDFTVTWQFSQREHFFLLWIKLHTLIQLVVSPPSFDTGALNGIMLGSQQSHISLKQFGLDEV
jgi:hypothetical protein